MPELPPRDPADMLARLMEARHRELHDLLRDLAERVEAVGRSNVAGLAEQQAIASDLKRACEDIGELRDWARKHEQWHDNHPSFDEVAATNRRFLRTYRVVLTLAVALIVATTALLVLIDAAVGPITQRLLELGRP